MKFNRGLGISRWTIAQRFLTCLVLGHHWSDWWWIEYQKKERRICAKCGLTQETTL